MRFHVGQRVRYKGAGMPRDASLPASVGIGIPNGALGTVIAPEAHWTSGFYYVAFDEFPSNHKSKSYANLPIWLEPIGDADSFGKFMERVLKPVDLGLVSA